MSRLWASLNLRILPNDIFEPDYKTFECLTACKKALDTGGTATAVVNGANEEANALFRQGKISFLEIGSLVTESLNAVKTINQKMLRMF